VRRDKVSDSKYLPLPDGVGMSACDPVCRADRGGHSVLPERGSGEYEPGCCTHVTFLPSQFEDDLFFYV
jgi:hypothetical protein